MTKAIVTLTRDQFAELEKLHRKIGYKTVPTLVVNEALVGSELSDDDVDVRKKAYETIVALGLAGALYYNRDAEKITILDVKILVDGVAVTQPENGKAAKTENQTPPSSEWNLDRYLKQLPPTRRRCLAEIVTVHLAYGTIHGNLPKMLAAKITEILREKYPNEKVLGKTGVQSVIGRLLEYKFLSRVESKRGVYRVTKHGLASWNRLHGSAQEPTETTTPAQSMPIAQ